MKISIVEKLNSTSIVYEVIGTILFFMKRFYMQKNKKTKKLKKHISKYTLTKHSNKRLLIYILCSLCFLREL